MVFKKYIVIVLCTLHAVQMQAGSLHVLSNFFARARTWLSAPVWSKSSVQRGDIVIGSMLCAATLGAFHYFGVFSSGYTKTTFKNASHNSHKKPFGLDITCLQQGELADVVCGIDHNFLDQVKEIDGATCGYHALKNSLIMLDEYYKYQDDSIQCIDLDRVESRALDQKQYLHFMQKALPYIINRRRQGNHANALGNWLEEQEIALDGRDSLLAALQDEQKDDSQEASFNQDAKGWKSTVRKLFPNIPSSVGNHITVVSQLANFDVTQNISERTTLHVQVGKVLEKMYQAMSEARYNSQQLSGDEPHKPARYMHCFIVNTSAHVETMDPGAGCHYVAFVVFVNTQGVIEVRTLNSMQRLSCDTVLAKLQDIFAGTKKEVFKNILRYSAADRATIWLNHYSRLGNAIENNNILSIFDVLFDDDVMDLATISQSTADTIKIDFAEKLQALRDNDLFVVVHDRIDTILQNLASLPEQEAKE